jgi:hypothetical protein
MTSSGMLRRVVLVRTDVLEELSASINRVTRIGELGTTLAVTSNLRALRRNTKYFKEYIQSTTRRNIPEDAIVHSHRRENLKSYIVTTYRSRFKVYEIWSGWGYDSMSFCITDQLLTGVSAFFRYRSGNASTGTVRHYISSS